MKLIMCSKFNRFIPSNITRLLLTATNVNNCEILFMYLFLIP